MCAKFHFVDLAGSERAHRTGNVGDRFKGKSDMKCYESFYCPGDISRFIEF